jgi:hypothetical protein
MSERELDNLHRCTIVDQQGREIVAQTMQAVAGRQSSTSDRCTPHGRPVRAVQWSAVHGEKQQLSRTLMNVPNIRPIFDDDLANWVYLDVSRERELNYLRQLDNAPAALRLKFAPIGWNSRHPLELLPYVDLPA